MPYAKGQRKEMSAVLFSVPKIFMRLAITFARVVILRPTCGTDIKFAFVQ